jgi:hypothetical protein
MEMLRKLLLTSLLVVIYNGSAPHLFGSLITTFIFIMAHLKVLDLATNSQCLYLDGLSDVMQFSSLLKTGACTCTCVLSSPLCFHAVTCLLVNQFK